MMLEVSFETTRGESLDQVRADACVRSTNSWGREYSAE
jgi:hypothetical protein